MLLGTHSFLFSVVDRPQTPGGHILFAGLATAFIFCSELQNGGPRSADAFELQLETRTKQDSSSDKTSFKGQIRDSLAWLTVKLEGGVWDINPSGVAVLRSTDQNTSDPFGSDLNKVLVAKSTLADTRFTLGVGDDWVRWTSRQALSNYITPLSNVAYVVRPGFGSNDIATSQHLDAAVWKTNTMRLSVFAEYDRVGAYFEAPRFAIKSQDPFSIPNSTTTRLGSAVEWGPITFTLEQRTQQSLAEDNAPIKAENIIGVLLSLDELRDRSRWIPQNVSWLMPSSVYLIVGQGRVRAMPPQGVNDDTASDVSAGFSWSRGNVSATFGYWMTNYQSQLYPWKGSGLDASLGFHDGEWGVDLYLDLYRSAYADVQPLAYVPAGQQVMTDNYFSGGVRFTGRF